MNHYWVALLFIALTISPAFGQQQEQEQEALPTPEFTGPTLNATYYVVLLIESDDQNRLAYDGPAREGLTAAGYDRLVIAGSATALATIGQRSGVTGNSRYGQLTVTTSMLNTAEENEVQVKIQLHTKNQSPIAIDTIARAPLGRWFLVGATDSRIGLPKNAADAKRAVAVMRIDEGVLTLD